METISIVEILAQPDNFTCGPTCFRAPIRENFLRRIELCKAGFDKR
jgi:hypothetical protein